MAISYTMYHAMLNCSTNNSGALLRAQLSTMGKKIWLSMHPINFGGHVCVRLPVPPARSPLKLY